MLIARIYYKSLVFMFFISNPNLKALVVNKFNNYNMYSIQFQILSTKKSNEVSRSYPMVMLTFGQR